MKQRLADIHYDTRSLSEEKALSLFREAYTVNTWWRFDKLDCSESIRRQPIDNISFDEALSYFDKKGMVYFVNRRAVQQYGEIGFTVDRHPEKYKHISYFLWIHVTPDKLLELASKYNIEPHEFHKQLL